MLRDSSLTKGSVYRNCFETICILTSGELYLDRILCKMALGRADGNYLETLVIPRHHHGLYSFLIFMMLYLTYVGSGAIAKFPHEHFCSASVGLDSLESRQT